MSSSNDDIIISGVSGRFPQSDNVEELWENLFTGKPLYGPDKFPYPKIFSRLPISRGYLKDTRFFDNNFFGYNAQEANTLDPQIRILLEVVYEAFWDAGIRPEEWRGTRTGFFLGSAFDDTGLSVRWDYKIDFPQYFAQRISYHYDWHGPCMIVDTACAASLNALHTAYWSIKHGLCDQAVVAGIALHLKPSITICFGELEMLSKSGVSWCLDERADGYIRSEAIVAVLLQRSSTCKRSYGAILGSSTSSDGYTKEGITFPRKEVQVATMRDALKHSGISASQVNYVEAHITGTAAGDPIESAAIMETYRGNSETPLLFGCLKSNIGHSEASAGLCALTKVIKIFQTGLIPPNINCINPNPRIESIREGYCIPVNKITTFNDQFISIDAFGFGGSNTHVILKGPSQSTSTSSERPTLPKLIFLCNRTDKGIQKMINHIENNLNQLTNDYMSLLNNLSATKPETGMVYRAFCLIDNGKLVFNKSTDISKTRLLCYIFDDFSASLPVYTINELCELQVFKESINKSLEFIQKNTIKHESKGKKGKSPVDLFSKFGSVFYQLALIDLLKSLHLEPDMIIGFGLGKIVANYASNQISWEDTMNLIIDNHNKKHNSDYNFTNKIDFNGKSDYLNVIKKIIKQGCDVNEKSDNFANHYINTNDHRNIFQSKESDWSVVRIDNNLSFLELFEQSPKKSTNTKLSLKSLLINLGEIYLTGHNPSIETFYPAVSYPVERNCPSIGHLIAWQHESTFENMIYPDFFRNSFRTSHRIDLMDSNFSELSGYHVNDQVTLPTAAYIWIVWDHLVKMRCEDQRLRSHSFEIWSTHIHRQTFIKDPVEFRVASNPVTHEFAIKLGEECCMTGYARIVDETQFSYDMYLEMDSSNKELLTLSGKEFYMEMLIRGIKVDQNCQTLTEITADASQAHIKFNGNWIIFLESCLTASLLNDIDRKLKTISYLEWFRCDPNILYEEFKTAKNLKGEAVVNLIRNDALETIAARGLVFKFPQYSEIPRQFELNPNLHHRYQRFLAYHGQLPLDNSIHRNLQSYLHLINEACDAFNSSNNWSNLSDVSTNRHSLLNILLESLERPNSIEHLKCQITNSKEILKHDQILFDIQTELSTQHLAIFEENVKPSSTVNIVHFGENHYSYQSLCYNQFRRIRSRYQFYISENESIPGKNCDLVIHTHKSMQLFPLKQDVDDINHLLEFLSNLEPSSFFMITMREQLFGWEEKLSSLVDLELSCLDNRKYFEKWLEEKNFLLISEYYVDKTVSLLFRKKFIPSPDKFYCNFIIAEEKSFKWITDLQRLVADKSQERIWLIANESYQSGIIGFIKSLNEEQFGQRIKCIFALNWDVSKNSQEFEIIKQKDLTINVLQDGSWGSYRHFELSTGDILIPQTNAYLAWNSKHISEPAWYKNLIIPSELYIVNCYSPLDLSFNITNKNYDQMKTASDEMVDGIGVEFAGIDNNGNKVIGLCRRQGISDLIPVSGIIFIQPIPDSWPLHDAASLILPYFLAYYSLFIRISLRKHSSILLYNLRDGLLEAAFAICKSFECQIYITKDKSFFPFSDITTNDVILSETNFTEKVLQATNNQGVDIILTMDSSQHLNQLTDCLADFGKILNITTKDNLTQNFFDPSILPINSSYESICLNQFLINLSSHQNNAGSLLEQLTMMFKKGFTAGQVKPITSLVIKRDNLSQALSSLSIKGQQGRVILQLREDNQSMDPIPVNCIARTYFYPDKCYILFGGLGGIGLQLAQWMVERGARKLVFISRSGITNEYQKFVLHRIQNWPRGHVTIKIVKLSDIEYSNIYRIFRESEALGDIGGVFNLAGILRSGLFENQTIDNFNVVCKSKVILTDFLDTITRLYCPKLDHFLCFSSIASTGLLGESNYCYANAYMERICEERKADGLPGIAIQLGAVNDVGMIKDGSSQVVSSFMNQPIISYIESLDKFLQLPYSVVYSAGHAEKQEDKDSSKGSLIQRIEHILGLKDLDSLDPNVTLGDLGLDSLQAIEVKELIDKTYGVSLQNIAIVRLKLSSLLRFKEELSDLKDADKFNEKILFTITDKGTSPIFFFPPALFDFLSMKVLAENLNRSVVGIDLTEEVRKIGNIHKIAEFYCKILLEKYPNEPKYYFVGYSYGCLVSFEVGKALQKIVGKDRMNCICFIDATPYGLKRVGQITMKAVLLGLPTSEIFCIAMDNLGINISETKRSQLLEAEDDTERYNELVSEIMASAGMNGPAEGFVNNPLTSIDRGYYLTSMNELGKFDGDALFVRVLNKENHSKLSTVNEGLPKIISGKIKEVLYNASHFDVLKVYAKEIARDIEEMMPLVF